MIFIGRDTALSEEEISRRLALLQDACDTGDDDMAREVLRKAVPTFIVFIFLKVLQNQELSIIG